MLLCYLHRKLSKNGQNLPLTLECITSKDVNNFRDHSYMINFDLAIFFVLYYYKNMYKNYT